MPRDYKKEYREYHGKPEQVAKRSQRNQARRAVEKTTGDLPTDKVVDHKVPIRKGGSNAGSNLKVASRGANAGWRKGKKGYD
jgi:5-methylcytosine-specific restriction endonuclease McrA